MTHNKNNGDIPPSQTPQPPTSGDAFQMMLQMQRQQMEMQERMTALMSHIIAPPDTPAPIPQQNRPLRAKLERPTIDADCTDNRWIIFRDAWTRYKQMASLTLEAEIRNELRSACSTKVNEMLFNFVGPDVLNNATEDELLDYIKSVSVKAVHPEVYRQQFFTLRQSDCESVTNFISRLKAQAMLCAFNGKGSCAQDACIVSYSEDMVKSQLIAGLRNPAHQSKVLSEMEALKTLDLVTTRLLALESTERASTHLRPSSEVAPITNQPFYRRDNKRNPISDPQKSKSCAGCGQQLHPKGRSSCPAWQKNCRKCGKPNHFASACRSSSSSATSASITDEPPLILSHIQTEPL